MSTLKGVIYAISDTQQVTESFKKRELILHERSNPSYPEHIKIEFQQDKTALLDKYMEGQEVEIDINIRGRLWTNPKGEEICFNTLVGWRIKVLEGSELPESTPSYVDLNQGADDEELPF